MKKIKIDFVDFWEGFNKKDNIIYNLLKNKYEIEITNKPTYVFCSLFGKTHMKYNNSIKILIIGENIAPDFNLYDYAIGFYDIKYEERYLKYNILLDDKMVKLAQGRKIENKKKFCAFVYSNKKLNSKRKEIFQKLNEYKKVDSGGGYLNNIGRRIGNSKEDKINFQKSYKFIIACENQSFKGYNTEKIIEAFASGGIPIYWGDPEIEKVYNEKAFINCNKFKNLEDVKKKVIEIDKDNKKYEEYIKQPIFNKNFNFENEKQSIEKFLEQIINKEYEDAKKVKMTKDYYIYNFYKPYMKINYLLDIIYKCRIYIKKIIKRKEQKRAFLIFAIYKFTSPAFLFECILIYL